MYNTSSNNWNTGANPALGLIPAISSNTTPGSLAGSLAATAARTCTGSPRYSLSEEEHAAIPWETVDAAMEILAAFDAVELAQHIVNRAIEKGAKDLYNEAGTVRFQLARLKQRYSTIQATICATSLEAKETQIRQLEEANEKRRRLAGR